MWGEATGHLTGMRGPILLVGLELFLLLPVVHRHKRVDRLFPGLRAVMVAESRRTGEVSSGAPQGIGKQTGDRDDSGRLRAARKSFVLFGRDGGI